MSDGAAQNGGAQAATTGEAAAVAVAAVAATAAAAPTVTQAVPGGAVPAVPAAVVPAPVVPAAVATSVAVAAPAVEADCAPPKKKVAHKHDKKETEEEHARATTSDEDQNLSQPADGCVLPQTGAQAAPAPAPQDGGAAIIDDSSGGGISSGLLIGAGVLAAVGVGVLAFAKDDEENAPPVAVADTGAVNEGATLTGSVATNDSDPENDPLTYALTGTAPAGLTLNTDGTYTFDANNAAYNSLAAGQTQVVTANYNVSDGNGTSSATLTITVTGTNDAPTVVADTAAVNEDATITGNLRTNDSDPDTTNTLTYTVVGTAPAGLTLNSNGTYTFNAGNAAYQGLVAGQTQTVVTTVAVTDGTAPAVNTTLTITVTGTNDLPVAVADTAVATEGGATVTGSVATNDTDADTGQTATLTYTVNGTPPAGFTLNSNGTYSFDPTNAAYNSLAAGQTQQVVVNYTVLDASGGTATSTLTITVTGTNDAPTVVADIAAVNEDATITGNLRTNDIEPDTNDTLTYTIVGTAPAGLTLNSDGTYSFNAGDAAYQSLALGQTQVVTATVAVTDGTGPAVNTTLTITITGTNDLPVAVADVAAATEGDATVTGSVATNDSDADTGQTATLTYTVNGTPPAGFTLNSDGTYSFDPTNAAYNSLAVGQTQQVVVNYTVLDASGGTATSTLTITVTGTNDAPTVVADIAAVNEDATITGNLRTNDIEPDTNDTLTYTIVGTAPAGLALNADGTYSFNAGNAAYQSLALGQTQVVTATVAVTDGNGPAVNTTLTITVTGTNDAPVAVADVAAGIEGAGNLTGTVANDTDVDTGAVLTYALNAPVAGLTLNADGSYTFDLNDPAYNSIAAGQTRDVIAAYTVTDAQGATSTSTLTVTITGTNDAPVATLDVNAGIEDTVIAGTVATNDTDPDTGDALTFSVVGAAPAGFILNADGTYTLDTRNAAYQNLSAGQTQNVVVNYQVADAGGLTSTATLTITVTGVAETANLDTDSDGSLATAQLFEAGLTDFIFSDDVRVASNAVVNNFGGDDIILFDGSVTDYTFVSGDFDADGVNDDVRITSNVGGAAGTVVLANSITAGTSVASEADLEAAIGTGVDNFRFTVTQSLDIDDDNNLNTNRSFDAASESFRFTDDADTANSAVIINFGANDKIVLEAGNSYSFANVDFDRDGLGNDLQITINKPGGVVSNIIIKDIVSSDAIAFDEARAEDAVNRFLGTTNVDYFQFA